MSFYLPKLWRAIYDRLVNDTGTGGLFADGNLLVNAVYNGNPPVQAAFPFISFTCAGSATQVEDAFQTCSRVVGITVDIWLEEQSTVGDMYDRAAKIMDRVRGNWPKGAVVAVPDFGLDRWAPTLEGGWTANALLSQGEEESHEDGRLHWIMNFDARVHLTP